ncbi:MAG: hypothetical protein IJT70_01585 [Clostridia bacterium]|nr:hypothetical protein [Clostridia bacterium]
MSEETVGDDTYEYTYDILGNITEIKKNGLSYRSYKYDALGELIRENNTDSGETYLYTYDEGGNILAKYVYPYTSGNVGGTPDDLIIYTYSTGDWKDLLTSYDGETISYDASIFCPAGYPAGRCVLQYRLQSFIITHKALSIL